MENNKIHILVVDDDNRIRDLLKEYLTEKDYIVSTSDNAENAKVKITQFKFDLIVLDVMMPGQNGYELTKEIKKNMKVPIILLTATSRFVFSSIAYSIPTSCKEPLSSKSIKLVYLNSSPKSENNFWAEIDIALVEINVFGKPIPGIK